MTKAEELINKHLDRLNANNIIGKDGNIYKGFLNAINEALTIPVVVKSFTAEDVVNELKENETLDDAISYFDNLK
tara:strand:+ start:311 stop:535 length:225 start_codon:yes stop_codon:yes gene_type:complete